MSEKTHDEAQISKLNRELSELKSVYKMADWSACAGIFESLIEFRIHEIGILEGKTTEL